MSFYLRNIIEQMDERRSQRDTIKTIKDKVENWEELTFEEKNY